MKKTRLLIVITTLLLALFTAAVSAGGKPDDTVSEKTRCTVCGMFVAKYPNWLAQIHYDSLDETKFFDGVKDMMVYYFNPEQYGGGPRETITDIFVRDYYTLQWLQAREAFYVIGSDVYGPMGHELVPFQSRDAAESFAKDHQGKRIITFGEISPELIDSMRAGQKMR